MNLRSLVYKQIVSYLLTFSSVYCQLVQQKGKITLYNLLPKCNHIVSFTYCCLCQYATERFSYYYRIESSSEVTCVIEAFIYLTSKLSRTDFLEPYLLDDGMSVAVEQPIEIFALTALSAVGRRCRPVPATSDYAPEQVLGRVLNSSEAPLSEAEGIYPCALVMCGSATGFFQASF